jgi:hypothetical protein
MVRDPAPWKMALLSRSWIGNNASPVSGVDVIFRNDDLARKA